ncbi:MAG: carboxypeptidase-like regulatory domain-containing protein [Flavobacteriales bacterium]|nr:carboxypeptidase-like regulatory domain-containing protein [Flavobacteriales bacterium]
MKNFFTLLMFLASFSLFAQNFTIKGSVVDTKGNPISGATIRTNVSKNTAKTDIKGQYSIEVTPQDKTIRMSVSGTESMSRRIYDKMKDKDVVFEIFATGDIGTGKMSSDMKTYYAGENDNTFFKMIDQHFSNCSYDSGYVIIRANRCTYYEVDGAPVSGLFSVDPLTVYSITILKDVADCVIYGGRAMYGAVLVKTKIGDKAPKGLKVQVSSSVSTGI